MKKKKDDGHRMGKEHGYTDLGEGRIRVAPVYEKELDKNFAEREAVNSIIDATNKSCKLLFEQINKRDKQLWNSMADDYGLDLEKYYYRYVDGIIKNMGERDPKK